ncbi:MAG: acyl-CoA synthetase [Actinomycetota bacterium]
MAYNIADLFEHTVDAVGDREVLVVGRQRMTYLQLEERANRLAHHLSARGIGPGDHIGVYGLNSVEWIEAALAAYKIRAVPVNVNYRYVTDELLYLFENADLKAVVYDIELAPRLAAVRPSLPLLQHLIHIDVGDQQDGDPVNAADAAEATQATTALESMAFEDAVASASPERDFAPRSADDHYVLYTGGTTGMPKGVVWRHEDVFFALGGGIDAYTNERVADEWTLAKKASSVESPLRSLNLPPLMHGAAQWGFLRFAFEGNLIVMLRRFDPHEVWRVVEREAINNISITGDAMARPMIEALDELGGPDALDLSSLFVLASTAAIFSPTVKDKYLEAFPNLLLIDAIGSSETGSNGMRVVAKGDTQNKGGGPTVQAARDSVVLDDDLTEIPPGSDRPGRLARRGNVPVAYYKDPAKSAATFVTGPSGDRYALAGDMAIAEADGTITLLGRGSQCINSGGEKIFPEEVEAALKAHPAVFDAIVVGVDDERWGQTVAAVVQPRPGEAPTLAALDAHCREYVAGYKVPRQLHLVDAVRRSPSGKPDYPWAAKVARGETSA